MDKWTFKKENGFFTTIVFLTLIISIYYYINAFVWGGGAESFKPAIIIYPLTVLTGAFIFLTKLPKKPLVLQISAFLAVYSFLFTLFQQTSLFSLFSSCVYVILWFALFIVFFYDSKKYGVSQFFIHSLWIAIPACVISFIFLVNDNQTETALKTLNPIFYLLYFIPFICLEKRTSVQMIGAGLVFIAILTSNKRTALLAFVVCFLYYTIFFIKSSTKNFKKLLNTILAVIIGITIAILLYTQVIKHYANLDWLDRLLSIWTTGGGGRTERWNQFFIDINNSTILEYIFGHGNVSPYYHNDLMQIFYNYGFLGSISYCIMCYLLIFEYFKMKKNKYEYTIAYGTSLIIFFITSSFGMVIVVHTWFLQMAMFWGIVLGDFYRFKQKIGVVLK